MSEGMRARLVRGAAALAFAGTVLASPLARAQNKPLAEQLFKEGRAAAEAKRYDEACPKFAASQKADPAIGTLLNLADCYEKNNQLASAWTTFLEAVSFATRINRPDRRQTAQERADKLEPRLVKLTILARASGIDVKFDGAPAVLGTAFPVDPGKHTIEATAKGKKPFTTTVDISDKSKNPSVDIPPLEDDTGGPKDPGVKEVPTDPPPDTATKSTWSTQKTLAVVSWGLGGIALGAGAFYGYTTSAKWADAQGNECNTDSPPQCTTRGVELAEQAKSAGTISTIAFVAGGLFVGGGFVLWFTAPKGGAAPPAAPPSGTTAPAATKSNALSNVRLGVGPGSFAVRGTF